jgi:hypothetical protein
MSRHDLRVWEMNAKDIFRVGASFEHSAQTVLSSMKERLRATGACAEPLEVPVMVCYALSAELYLKSHILLENENWKPHGHQLEELFGLLSKEAQARIERYYHAVLKVAKEQLGVIPDEMEADAKDFCHILRVASLDFVKFRYAYENKIEPGTHLTQFLAYAVRRSIIELHSDWEQFLAGHSMPPTSLTH